MKSLDVRKQFIDFFLDKEHRFVRSSSVVPVDDPTLLFTNAGMNQFKDIFLNLKKPEFARAVNSQKCIRVSGKHNDLEEVGVDHFHHTFFEMLGNWSFGDYYKQESIDWAWELFTKHWKLDKDRLWVSIYEDDDESYDIWSKVKDLDSDRILRFGSKDNFWEMGDTGPCGPCSEIHYYTGENPSKQSAKGVNNEDDYRELWNLVFIQYNREKDGSLSSLPMKHVDTGLGLERITSVLSGITDHYSTDLFQPLISQIVDISGKDFNFKSGTPHRVISDHIRMLAFSIADGAIPSNDGRGYVLRRVLRRAVRYADLIGIKDVFLGDLVDTLISTVKGSYPEIEDKKSHIVNTLSREEDLFRNTLEKGLVKFDEIISQSKGNKNFSGKDAFKLYDTYGFPVDLTRLLCDEKNIVIDESEFDEQMAVQKKQSKKLDKFKYDEENIDWIGIKEGLNPIFVGYDKMSAKSKIESYFEKEGLVYIVLDKTPFYSESGGQVSDTGKIYNSNIELNVVDVQKIDGLVCHICKVEKGKFSMKDSLVIAEIDKESRLKIMSNHTATHMLHEALKQVLGSHVQQSGSLVEANRLRFDYTHTQKMNSKEVESVEKMVNGNILKNVKLGTTVSSYDSAIKNGAIGLFGEKYEDDVRVVDIPGFSKELCGGTHVSRTGDIGLFKIVSDASLSSGVRRIEALTGEKCFDYLRANLDKVKSIQEILKCDEESVIDSVLTLKENNLKTVKINEKLMVQNQESIVQDMIGSCQEINGVGFAHKVIDGDVDENALSDQFRSLKKNKGILIAGLVRNNNPMIICSITDDLTDAYNANDIIKIAAKYIDGGGGGKKHFAKAGGKDVKMLKEAILKTKKEIFK